jgi:signal transduction histidine kinase
MMAPATVLWRTRLMELDPNEALRSRLATESFFAQKQRELAQANTRIAERAKVLSNEVIERRTEAAQARSEAERERRRHIEAMTNLRKAKSETNIAERRLWTSLESIADGFAVFDREQRVVAANPAFFLPYADMDCVTLGITYGELVDIAIEEGLVDPGGMRPSEWAVWMRSRWEARTIPPVTLRFWTNQFVRLTERRTPDGDVVMMGMDITRQIRRQKVLEEARHRAEAANRAKSAFLANMSHEIRTPMNGVLAMAEMMAEDPLTEDQQLCLDTIKSSGEALLVIINDVLDYSKIEAQKLAIENRTFDLEAAINEVTTLLMPTAREKGLSLVVDYDIFLPTLFDGDKGRIRQILMNLVGNAVKFTNEGHVLVRVVGLPDPRPEHYRLHITVEDTGIGVPAEMREHIFGEFNQVQSEMTREFDGTGLGLAITRRLVAMMGGDMWVDNGAESGSVFGFRLTLRKEGPDIEGLRGRFGYRRVLLCDPNAKSREVMIKHMMALGLRPEAVDACDEQTLSGLGPDDLVILCEDRGINGTVRIGSGPNFITDAQTVPRPLLRDAMLQALTDATRRSVRPSGTGERRAAHRAEILSLRPAEPSNFSPTYPTISF